MKEVILIIAVGVVMFTLGFQIGNEVGWWRCYRSWEKAHKKTLEEKDNL